MDDKVVRINERAPTLRTGRIFPLRTDQDFSQARSAYLDQESTGETVLFCRSDADLDDPLCDRAIREFKPKVQVDVHWPGFYVGVGASPPQRAL